MPARRQFKGVLDNFMGTFTSRYSGYRTGWLYAHLVEHLGVLKFNLFEDAPTGTDPISYAHRLAIERFGEQMAKARVSRDQIKAASVRIWRDKEPIWGHRGEPCWGYRVHVVGRAEDVRGLAFESTYSHWVAPYEEEREKKVRQW